MKHQVNKTLGSKPHLSATMTPQTVKRKQQKQQSQSITTTANLNHHQCHGRHHKPSIGLQCLIGLTLALVVCSVVVPTSAHDRLIVEGANKQRRPPAIYSYSAGELDPPGSSAALNPLWSSGHHRLDRQPYSWSNQRVAKLMATESGEVQEDTGSGGSVGGSILMTGDNDDQMDLSLLYGRQQTKTQMTSPANRWPARGNRRRRPSAAGTKRRATGTKTTRTTSSERPDVKGWAASPALADGQSREAPTTFVNRTTKRVLRPTKRKNLVCYYGTWAVYRPDGGKFAVEDIDPFLCTHVIYGFTGLSYDNLIKPLDPWNDLEDNYGKGAMKRFTNLKRINPDLKTLVAIGGWNEGSIKYSKMASDPQARARFVDSVVQFLDKYNFDGLDLDWEYPGSRGGASYDKQNFVKLLRELHEAFQPRQYLLTAAVSAGKWFIDPAYDIPQVSKYLDLINLMAYDYHGGWETKTGMNAPLFSSRQHDLTREDQMLNVNWSVNYWLAMGAQREKIMLGVGSYGRSFTLDKAQVNGLNAAASQKGQAGPYTREPGSLGYNELCEAFKRQPQSWTIVRDPDYLAPYAFNRDRQWVGYDDQQSLALKAQFAKSMGLGGVMMWSIETDDFRGSCHGEKFPLLNTIRRVMDGSGSSEPPKPPPIAPVPTSSTTTSTTRRPAGTSSTKRPGHEVEEGDQQRPAATSSTTTRRPLPPVTSSARPRPPLPVATSAKPARPTTGRPTTGGRPPRPSTTTTTSTSTTTTMSPRPPMQFTCRETGTFADPQNCRKFIRCVQMGPIVQKYNFDCPPGTAYNEQQQYCDHLYNVPQCTSSNRWQSGGEVEEVARMSSLPGASGANTYPSQQQQQQALIPLIAVGAGHHYPHFLAPHLATNQHPLIVQWG